MDGVVGKIELSTRLQPSFALGEKKNISPIQIVPCLVMYWHEKPPISHNNTIIL